MPKKLFSIIIFVLLISAVGFGLAFLVKKIPTKTNLSEAQQAEFRKTLKGEIVFVRRDGLYLDIYRINADGTGEKMIYHNPADISAYLPEWSEDGTKIYFTSVEKKGGQAVRFVMDSNGDNAEILQNETPNILSRTSREKDIIVELGAIYYLNEKKEKVLVLPHKDYDSYENPGAVEVSWGPDKEYIIFILNGYITIISKDGKNMARITQGGEPDWKY